MLIDTQSIISQIKKEKRPSLFLDDDRCDADILLKIPNRSKLEDAFGTIKKDVTYHFCTAGRWSQYELMNYLLSHTGPADVYLTTWKINDLVAGNLFTSIKSGIIRNLYTILEKRISITAPEAKDLLLSNSAKHRVTDNHSKVIVIMNDEWGIVVNGSANMTINPRIEAGTVCTKRSVAEFTKNWIIEEIENGNSLRG